jgi:hypothetical protein
MSYIDGRGQVCLNEPDDVDRVESSAGGGDHSGASGQEAVDSGTAQTLGAAADEHALAREFGWINFDCHAVISSALMASFSSVQR